MHFSSRLNTGNEGAFCVDDDKLGVISGYRHKLKQTGVQISSSSDFTNVSDLKTCSILLVTSSHFAPHLRSVYDFRSYIKTNEKNKFGAVVSLISKFVLP